MGIPVCALIFFSFHLPCWFAPLVAEEGLLDDECLRGCRSAATSAVVIDDRLPHADAAPGDWLVHCKVLAYFNATCVLNRSSSKSRSLSNSHRSPASSTYPSKVGEDWSGTTYVTFVTLHQLETVLDSVLDSNLSQAIGDLIARRVIYGRPCSSVAAWVVQQVFRTSPERTLPQKA